MNRKNLRKVAFISGETINTLIHTGMVYLYNYLSSKANDSIHHCFQNLGLVNWTFNSKIRNISNLNSSIQKSEISFFDYLLEEDVLIKSILGTVLERHEGEIQRVPLVKLIAIRIKQLNIKRIPEGLEKQAAFLEELNRQIYIKFSDMLLNSPVQDDFVNDLMYSKPLNIPYILQNQCCPLKHILFSNRSEKKLCSTTKCELGSNIIIILGIIQILKKISNSNVTEKNPLKCDIDILNYIKISDSWWRFVLRFPVELLTNCDHEIQNIFLKASLLSDSKSNDILDLKKAWAIESYRVCVVILYSINQVHLFEIIVCYDANTSKWSYKVNLLKNNNEKSCKSIDAINRILINNGTILLNCFFSFPKLYISLFRPEHTDVFIYESINSSNYGICDLIQCSKNTQNVMKTLLVLKISPNQDLRLFIPFENVVESFDHELKYAVLNKKSKLASVSCQTKEFTLNRCSITKSSIPCSVIKDCILRSRNPLSSTELNHYGVDLHRIPSNIRNISNEIAYKNCCEVNGTVTKRNSQTIFKKLTSKSTTINKKALESMSLEYNTLRLLNSPEEV